MWRQASRDYGRSMTSPPIGDAVPAAGIRSTRSAYPCRFGQPVNTLYSLTRRSHDHNDGAYERAGR